METTDTNENLAIEKRKEKIAEFLKKRYDWISYAVLAIIVWISIRIRSANIGGLRDITTGGWTLGPDLDPFLFLRWAKYIVEHGSLMVIDIFRNVPLGFVTKEELLLLPYSIAWFHKIAGIFGSSSIEQSAALYPVFMFALTVIAFFFLTRELFADSLGKVKANVIALLASFFLTVMPALLPRTIAGIPEKESAAFLFMFLGFYFFLRSWKAASMKGRTISGLLAGASTAAMALVWGGFGYVFLVIGASSMLAFLLEQVDKNKFYSYAIWMFSSFALMYPFSTKYTPANLVVSTTTGSAIFVFGILLIHFIIFNTRIKNYFDGRLSKLPKPVVSIIATILIGLVLSTFLFGPGFISDKTKDTLNHLVHPFAVDRFSLTVAENRMPYFNEWAGSFGKFAGKLPLFFWLFFFGSVYLFSYLVGIFEKKERIRLILAYGVFLIALIFSRYSATSTLNGENFASNAVYFGGMLVLAITFGMYYWKYYKKGEIEKLKALDFGLIMIFILFFLSIVSARGGVRLVMMLVPPTAIIVPYFAVNIYSDYKKVKDELLRVIAIIAVGLVIITSLLSAYQFYNESSSQAQGFVPSVYTQQWQKAMQWTRENTPENAVFGHWWDYGYWVQSIGNRATALDGGNSIVYWNHMMGRYALTGRDDFQAVDYLYSHNVTYFLIDSTDIGKYPAYSCIGSDENGDRYSWISTFGRDDSQTRETKNSTAYVYPGGMSVDGDIIYELNGVKIFLPAKKSGVAGVIVERDKEGKLLQPNGIYYYQGKQYRIPLRYAYDKNLIDFGSGLDAGIFLMPALDRTRGILEDGALIYLSSKTVKSQVARLYLYGEENEYFKIAHVEDDFVVSQIKEQTKGQNISLGEFLALDGGFRGPIKIWGISYPANIKFDSKYLLKEYPDPALRWNPC